MEEPGFWDDADKANAQMKELKNLEDLLKEYDSLCEKYEDVQTLIEMGNEEEDASLVPEAQEELETFKEGFDSLRLRTLMNGEYDDNGAILRLNAGAGGTEACDWCNMLYRMYSRWAEKHGFKVTVLDMLEGDTAGLKSVTMQIDGENAYGYLKGEKGVHRLVRISPYNAAGKRQTSFSSCDVMPDIKEDLNIEITRSGSIPTGPAAPADSISTRLHPPSASRICPRALLSHARTSVLSI